MHEKNDYWFRERECERIFAEGGPYYFITTENLDWLLYTNVEEFKAGTNLLATAAGRTGFTLLDDVQMNNHHHIMGEGKFECVQCFVDCFRELERMYQNQIGHGSLKNWSIRIDEVLDLKSFRNRIAYSDRNAYVARLDATPFGYPWSSANLLFNGNLWLMKEGVPYNSLCVRAKRAICHSHEIDLPDSYRVLDGMILRRSFVNFKKTESLFNSANQYFTRLTRRGEADVEIASILGEKIQLPTEEVFQIVAGWLKGNNIRSMEKEKLLQCAKAMKQRLNSSNRQIVQVLGLTSEEVGRIFPIPR